jgi:HEAT repeat protein
MKFGLRIVALAGFATLFCLSAIFFRRLPDPQYHAKPASQWAEDLLSPDYLTRSDAQAAFLFLGERATPQLRVLLLRKNQPWEPLLAHVNKFVPLYIKPYDPALCGQRAAEMLGLLGSKAREALPDLISSLGSDPIASEAERAIVRIGPDAEVPLQLALRTGNAEVRRRAARLLKEFNPASPGSISTLIAALQDRDKLVRKGAATSLGELRNADPLINVQLLSLLEDHTPDVRASTIAAFGNRMVRTGPARERMLRALADPALIVRLEAARSLWKIFHDAAIVVPTLIAILPTSEGWQAAYTLADIGAPASPAVPALVKVLLRERVPRPYRTPPSSAFALGHIGPVAIPYLAEALQETDSRIRISAVMAFSFMGKGAEPAIPPLLKLLNDHDAEVRHTAALTLAAIGAEPEKIIPGLSDCLYAEDIYMRSAAADKLREIAPGGNWVVNPE